MESPDLSNPDLYFNRELSLLAFNRRVLELAEDASQPILERLRYLCISSTNLDEFFEVRVAGLKQQLALGVPKPGADGLSPQEQLRRVSELAHQLVDDQYRVFNDVMQPALESVDVRFVRRTDWSPEQERWVRDYFLNEVAPVLSPLGLDPSHPFPRLLNKSLNFVITLYGVDPFGRDSGVAVVQAPRSLPRLIRMPAELAQGPNDFVFLSSMIHAHVGELFPGMTITGSYQFRVTRNSELFVDEEEIDNLLSALKGELPSRNFGQAVRLEVADNCPPELAQFLLTEFKLGEADLYQVNGPVNLNRMINVIDLVDTPDLKYRPFTPGLPSPLVQDANLFSLLQQQGDILLHHPYQSFVPVIEFIRQAAADPDVLAIKQTLYRTGSNSALVDALVEAARAGKEVTVVVELRARFDEEANIHLADRLHNAGCQVVYGIVGYKTHAKMVLVVRREKEGLVRYIHLGTGNYHAGTARAYTDYGLLSCDPRLGEEVQKVFQQLTGPGRVDGMDHLLQSPFTLHSGMLEKVEREIAFAEAGEEARIVAKMNSLVEPQVIQALYRASQAGVKVDLMVRGVCCLRPGIEGVSENIHVRSVMGRFLEHTRVFYFHNGGQSELYCGSADWMQRNFFQRVEVCFPILDARLKARVEQECLNNYMHDNVQSWVLQEDGSYVRITPTDGEEPHSAQEKLLEELGRL